MLIKNSELYSFWSHHLVAQCHINGATTLVNAILNLLVHLSQLKKYHSKSTDFYRSRYSLPYHCTELLILTIVFSVLQVLIKDSELYSFWSHHLVARCHINGATALVNTMLNFLVNLSQLKKYRSKSTDFYRFQYSLLYQLNELLILNIVFSILQVQIKDSEPQSFDHTV